MSHDARRRYAQLPQPTQEALKARALELLATFPAPHIPLADALLERFLEEQPELHYLTRNSEALQAMARALTDKASTACLTAMNAQQAPGGTYLLGELLERVLVRARRQAGGETPATLLAHGERLLADEGASLYRDSLASLASHLHHAVGLELAERLWQQVRASPAQWPRVAWLRPGHHLLLSVDHTSLSCARYLAGLQEARSDVYGFDELPAKQGRRGKRVEQVTVKVDPARPLAADSETANDPVLASIEAHRTELKAKTFVAVLALAAEAAAQGETRFCVRLKDLMNLLSFSLGRRTSSSYYWNYAAELTRTLLVDLPSRVVAMQVTLPQAHAPQIVFERLLVHATAIGFHGPIKHAVMAALRTDDPEALARAVREASLKGFELELSSELMRALGLTRPMYALEELPSAVLALKGLAFWLAWQVAFLRRWAAPPESGRQGKVLLKVLQEAGYLERFRRGRRLRLKDALRAWWQDVGELVTLGVLDEPGVRLYRWRGTSWQETSTELSRLLDPAGQRVNEALLQDTRVLYAIPAARVAQLQGARQRSKRLQNARASSSEPPLSG